MDAWISNTAKHMSDYYLEEALRDQKERSLTYEQAKERLEKVGYKVWNANGMGYGAPLLGYSHPKLSYGGIQFVLLPEDIDRMVRNVTPWWRRAT